MKKYISFLLIGLSFLLTSTSHAAVSPIAVSILPPLQFPPEDFAITGARVSLLWGKHRNMYGVDIGGLGNITEQSFVGVGLAGVFNITQGMTTIIGLQAAGVANYNANKTKVVGLQAALGLNMNMAESTVSGLQVALANVSPFTNVYGLQAGVYNKAKDVYGLQIGVVNVAESLHGLQIGLLNFNHTGTFVVSPILNAGF